MPFVCLEPGIHWVGRSAMACPFFGSCVLATTAGQTPTSSSMCGGGTGSRAPTGAQRKSSMRSSCTVVQIKAFAVPQFPQFHLFPPADESLLPALPLSRRRRSRASRAGAGAGAGAGTFARARARDRASFYLFLCVAMSPCPRVPEYQTVARSIEALLPRPSTHASTLAFPSVNHVPCQQDGQGCP